MAGPDPVALADDALDPKKEDAVADEDGTDYLALPRLGHALAVANRGFAERWAVVPRPVQGAASGRTPRLLDTFGPTPEQVRAWAFDPDLWFAAQDEGLAVSRPEYLAQLVELAADPRSPKRELIARIVDRIATMPRCDLVESMTRARDLARSTGDPGLAAWVTHAHGSGPIDESTGSIAWAWEPLSLDALASLPTHPRMASFASA